MHFDLDKRAAALGVGEFSTFSLGPKEPGDGGSAGIWRAQLGTRWHNELRARATVEFASAAEFELPVSGRIVHRGWTLSFAGRIDQVIRTPGAELPEVAAAAIRHQDVGARPTLTLREVKTITRALPSDEAELRRDYPEYFIQLAAYVSLTRSGLLAPDSGATASRLLQGEAAATRVGGELLFVEVGSGIAQTIPYTPADDALFRAQLDRLTEFLDLRLRARERLRGLRYRPAFLTPRPGQETTLRELVSVFEKSPLVLFEAPTGFGKTGVLLEFALGQLKSGHFDRALYLTSKSTGQLQVVRTLQQMTRTEAEPAVTSESAVAQHLASNTAAATAAPPDAPSTAVAVWHVRNKAEHCVNTTFHCVRDNCAYLAGATERWPASGLARFYLDEHHARDLDTLRAAGRDARICPYEITRAALAFNDVWIGDYNYVFSPRTRPLFYEQPGFDAARTLLLVDEAHNLPPRVADAFSHGFSAHDAFAVRDELHRVRPLATLVTAWDHWCHFLQHLKATDSLSAADEDDALHLLGEIAKLLGGSAIDYAALGAHAAEALWEIPAVLDELKTDELPRLWWCPRDAELALTCLDAAKAIGRTIREFGGVVLASATLTPVDGFATACGLVSDDRKPDPSRGRNTSPYPRRTGAAPQPAPTSPERLGELTKRDTKKLFKQLTTGADLLRVEEERDASAPALLRAHAPWREGTYDIAYDTRVDTTFQHRSLHYATTAATVAALQVRAGGPIAIFFPSYAYADAIRQQLLADHPDTRAALQPKVRDLNAQTAWVEEALLVGDALFLVLGSSFAESIDVLGGRINHAMVVGPALPEVNAVQRARLAVVTRGGASRDAAFRHVYQVPGMTKVNQALGRLVRAPGHHARVLLHCRRFQEATYLNLLAPEYRAGRLIADDTALATWLA